MNKTFFSIVMPVHNEERYLPLNLDAISKIDYPKESFEVIVVENGSTDKTYEIAQRLAAGNVRVIISQKGVSKAKNAGLDAASAESDWIVLLDADTIIGPDFLSDLDAYLSSRAKDGLSVGTTTVLPLGERRLKADLWFAFYNIGHALTKTSFAIQIMKASFRPMVRFDEERNFGEDLKLIGDLRRLGRFFYFKTRDVHTSTRRFDEVGWFRLFIKWNWQALVLSKTRKKSADYDVIR